MGARKGGYRREFPANCATRMSVNECDLLRDYLKKQKPPEFVLRFEQIAKPDGPLVFIK